MAPLASADDDFLILEFIAGHRRTPHAVFHHFLASLTLTSPSAVPLTSQRLRQAVVLRALDATLRTEGASSLLLLHKAREVLADPAVAACFPHQIAVADNEEDDEARAAAAVADLRRLLDLEWANLPPSTLKRAAADHTKRTKLDLLVEESTERENFAKLVQEGSASVPPVLPKVADNVTNADEADGAGGDEVADNVRNADEADGALRDDEADSSIETSEADAGQEGMAGHQNASVKGAEGQVPEKSVHASKNRSLMEKNPNASAYEWDGSDDVPKPTQDGSTSDPPVLPKVADNVSNANKADGALRDEVADNVTNANEADGAPRDDEADSSIETSEADAGQEGMAGHQNASVKGAEGQVPEKSAHASKKRNLMERNPNASTYEWDGSDDDQPVQKRKLHPVEREPYPSPTCAFKIRKKWSEIEEKTLLEGVEKYGKGKWKDIKLAYPDVFEERSTVDLKDKFRNWEKYHHQSA